MSLCRLAWIPLVCFVGQSLFIPTARAQCQTGAGLFDYTPHRLDAEAEQMAMRLTGELRAPESEYLRFQRDLQIIRNKFPELTGVVGQPRYVPDQLILRFEDTPIRSNYNALNLYYQVIEKRLISATLDIWVITFCDNLNIVTLFPEYSALPEVRYAEPNWMIGDGDNIEFELIGTTLRYTIAHGFGDCPSGCICSQQWVLEVDLDGNLNFVSYNELGSSSYCAFEEIGCCLGDEGCRMMLSADCVELGGTPLVPVTNCDALNDVNVDSDDVMECYASETAVAATIPAVSTWGLIVLALTVLIGGTVCIRRIPNFTTNHS